VAETSEGNVPGASVLHWRLYLLLQPVVTARCCFMASARPADPYPAVSQRRLMPLARFINVSLLYRAGQRPACYHCRPATWII